MKAKTWCQEAAQIMAANPYAIETRGDSRRLDARETALFQLELEQLMTEFFNVEFSPLDFRVFFPVRSTTSPGAETVAYRQMEMFGQAKKIGDYAGDLPHVNVQGVKFTNEIVPFGASYVISLQDIRNALFAGMPLEPEMIDAARLAVEQSFNEVALRGEATAGAEGFLNHSVIPSGAAVTGTWSTASADQIYEDMLAGIQAVVTATQGRMPPNTVLLPRVVQQYMGTRMTGGSDTTVLGFFQQHMPGVAIHFTHELATEAFYYHRSPRTGWVEIPQEFEQFPPQWKNLAYSVACHGRTGGAIVPYPIAFYRQTGL